MAAPAAASLPERLGPYTLLSELGQGGMARVYLAQRDGARELCVVKRLHPEVLDRQGVVRRFRREAELAAQLDHPNIARVLDARFDGGLGYIVLEHVAGQTLEALLERTRTVLGAFPLDAALALGRLVLAGLAHAHALTDAAGRHLGLVHRDLSPRNLMVSYAGELKIIDFGVARGALGDFRTEPGTLVGTVPYFSPEQALGEAVDLRSDLYTVAVVLHELLNGRHYLGHLTQAIDMLVAIQRVDPLPLTRLDPALEPVDRALAPALVKDPARRYLSAADMSRALPRLASAVDLEEAAAAKILARFMQRLYPGPRPAIGAPRPPAELEERTRTAFAPSALGAAERPVELEGRTRTAFVPGAVGAAERPVELEERTRTALPPDATRLPTPQGAAAPWPSGQARPVWLVPLALLLFSLVVVGVAAVIASRERALQAAAHLAGAAGPATPALPEPSASPRQPLSTARPEPAPAPPVAQRAAEPARRAGPPPEREPPPGSPQPTASALTRLERAMAELEQRPTDVELAEQLRAGIAAEASLLPPEERRKVLAVLDQASRTGDVELLGDALRALARYRAAR